MSASPRLTVRDVSGHAFIAAYAEHLKKGGKLEIPKWAEYIKTGVARELGPIQDDWYFRRAGTCVHATSHFVGCMLGALPCGWYVCSYIVVLVREFM